MVKLIWEIGRNYGTEYDGNLTSDFKSLHKKMHKKSIYSTNELTDNGAPRQKTMFSLLFHVAVPDQKRQQDLTVWLLKIRLNVIRSPCSALQLFKTEISHQSFVWNLGFSS